MFYPLLSSPYCEKLIGRRTSAFRFRRKHYPMKTPELALALSYPEDFQVTRHMQVTARGKRQILSCRVQGVL